jgi:hypothetical protein
MLKLGDFMVLAPVVGFVFQVELAELVGAQDKVVTQVVVTDFGQAGMLGDEFATGALLPGQTHVLGQLLVSIKAGDVDDRSTELTSQSRPECPR